MYNELTMFSKLGNPNDSKYTHTYVHILHSMCMRSIIRENKYIQIGMLHIWLKQSGYSQPKATSLSGTMLASLSLSPVFHLRTVWKWEQDLDVQVFMCPSWQQTCRRLPAAAGTQGLLPQMWCAWETLRSCRRDIYKSTGSRTFNTFNPSCTSFSCMFLIRSLKEKHLDLLTGGWKLCKLTGTNVQSVHVLSTYGPFYTGTYTRCT